MSNIFLDHPRSVGETYFQHMKFALIFSINMYIGSFACFIHAFLPFLFQRTGSNRLFKMITDYVSRILNVDERMKKLYFILKEKVEPQNQEYKILEKVV